MDDSPRFWYEGRMDLLDFYGEEMKQAVLNGLREEPEAWLAEAEFLVGQLNEFGGATWFSMNQNPPQNSKNLTKLSDTIFYYDGPEFQNRGIWRRGNQWSQLPLCDRAYVKFFSSLSHPPARALLPATVQASATRLDKEKRPIYRYELPEHDLALYVKGTVTHTMVYSKIPWHRRTPIASVERTRAEREVRITEELREQGIALPRTVASYSSRCEDYTYVEEVPGPHPDGAHRGFKEDIIVQDARMLAGILKAGYFKHGFTDFDDKIWSDGRLYLIDVDETMDLYSWKKDGMWDALRDPTDAQAVPHFRAEQQSVFIHHLEAAVLGYRNTFTSSYDDRLLYINTFMDAMGMPSVPEDAAKVDFPIAEHIPHDHPLRGHRLLDE